MKSQNERVINYSRNRSIIHVQSESQALTPIGIDFETADNDQVINGTQNGSYLHGPWREAILSRGPFTHFLTVTYSHDYSDHIAIESVRKLIEHINRDIFGSRWKKKKRGIIGVAIAERHKVSLDFRGQLHFHILLRTSHIRLSHKELSTLFIDTALRLTDAKGRLMTHSKNVDVRSVDNEYNLSGYLVKDLNCEHWQSGDNITFISEGIGMDHFQFTNKNKKQLANFR